MDLDGFYDMFKNKMDETKRNASNDSYIFNLNVSSYLNKILYMPYQYKNKNRFEHYDIISQYYWIDSYNMDKLVRYSSLCMGGQHILKRCNEHMINLSNDTILNLFQDSTMSCTFPVFLYYIDIIKMKNICLSDIKYAITLRSIITGGFRNTDDRIYKYIIKNYDIKTIFANVQLDRLIAACTKHPTKYILRRLKDLSSVMDIKKEFNMILAEVLSSTRENENFLIESIIKYYYHDIARLSKDNIVVIFDILCDEKNYNQAKTPNLIQYIYDITNTNLEKNMMVFYYINNFRTIGDYMFKPMNTDEEKIFSTFIKDIFIRYVYSYKHFKEIIPLDCIKYIMDLYTMEERMDIFSVSINNMNDMMYMLPYIYCKTGDKAIFFNKLRFYFSVFIRKQKKTKAIIRKVKMFPILNEIKNIVPQLRRQKKTYQYNKIPPYHLFPGMLQYYARINNSFLLREKADGVMVHSLPANIYPPVDFTNEIKAEYIEDLDLYLVHDIDMEGNMIDRLLYIFKQHKSTKNYTINHINNTIEMIDSINMERSKLEKFLDEPYISYRWYPKTAWYVDNMKPFIEPLTNVINMGDIVKWLCEDGVIKNDGFILSPMDGTREIKIKPKSHYTIDLEYRDGNFYDRDNTTWDIVKSDDIDIYNAIWRCYPDGHKFVARELRHDKLKPNTFEICDNIVNLYKADYTMEYNMIYNHIINKDNLLRDYPKWDNIIKSNQDNIKKIFPEFSGNVLDCGCGNGKNIKYMKGDFKYIGLDIDVNMLGSAIVNMCDNSKHKFSYYDFNNCDSIKWLTFDNIKYDYILCINSLMHFNTDTYWELLEKITVKGTIMIFNLLELEGRYNIDEKHYIERKGEMVEYMFPIHNNIMTEKYIDNIMEILQKYNWKIISSEKFINNNMTDCYKWYKIVKN